MEGQKAIKKLKEYSKEKSKTVKQWLSREAFWQVHLPAPKSIDRPHYQITSPNEMHQFDLLYMPSDTLYGNKYKSRWSILTHFAPGEPSYVNNWKTGTDRNLKLGRS